MFEKESSIIRDGSLFDYGYVPKNLVNREEQFKRLETLFRPFAVDGRSCSAFLTGGVGTGKTVTARRFCADMAEHMATKGRPVDVIYVNCRNLSESGVLLQLIHHYDRGFPERGFSAEDMARFLAQHLVTNTRSLTVILDEVDILLKKGSTNIVYQLTRTSEQSASVSLIMISQEPIEALLDEASMSTFRRTNTVKFNRYSQEELKEIVAARADEALFPGRITEDSLELIAEQAAEYGDARMAIELLDRASNIAEEDDVGEVTTEHVRAAKAMIYSAVSDSKLRSLDINRKLVLLATARAMKTHLAITSATIEKTYAIACEEYDVPARKHTQFWTYLKDLEKIGIIRIYTIADGTGKVMMVSLPDVPSKVLAAKMEVMVEEVQDDEV